MKILINTPNLRAHSGGVANHYLGLKTHWSLNVTYNVIGKRNKLPRLLILMYDYFKFILICIFNNYDLIVLNPSLGETAIKRDALFLKIAKFFNLSVVVFFHGWDQDLVDKINLNNKIFNNKFKRADAFIVLSKQFKFDLIEWGITKPIFLSSTKIDDKLISNFDISSKTYSQNILFLSRVEIYKGIYVALESFKIIRENFPNTNLIIAGDGSELQSAKEFVETNKIEGVNFLGRIKGNDLINAFFDSDIYILPSHGEGMPTTVLEAMAFGLSIISRPVGGLKDFFVNNEMGYLIDSLDPKDFANKIQTLLNNKNLCKTIGEYNHKYAKNRFLASKVAKELEAIFKDFE